MLYIRTGDVVHVEVDFRRNRLKHAVGSFARYGMTFAAFVGLIWRNGVIVTPSIHVALPTFQSNGSIRYCVLTILIKKDHHCKLLRRGSQVFRSGS